MPESPFPDRYLRKACAQAALDHHFVPTAPMQFSGPSPTIVASAAEATKRSLVASLIFLIYDHGLTFEDELEFVWRRPRSLGKALFIFNRYFALVALSIQVALFFTQHTDDFCKRFLWWDGISTLAVIVSAEVILIARIYAVYDCNKRLLVILIAMGALELVGSLIIELLALPKIPAIGLRSSGCFATSIPSFYFAVWLPAITVEVTLMSLMLYKAWRLSRETGNFPLLRLIIRDSVLYFFTNVAALLVNCLIWALRRDIIDEVALSWAIAVPCAMVSRLLLNMRRRYYVEQENVAIRSSLIEGMELTSLRVAGLEIEIPWTRSTPRSPPGIELPGIPVTS
ncbi:hypothetical protein K439DRAFT_1636880 [Ramaria rubella]|nr:hypothetical protein K439DRAFT_1636880 [Ramaria rubella]